MAGKAVNTAEVTETREEAAESPLLDSLVAAIKKMLARGKERGYVTYDELNAALPPDQVSSEQIEDTMTMLSELGVNVIETEESEEPAAAEAEEGDGEVRGNLDDDDIGRTDDPVRMYLREMGSVELLSREGEIAIAKRIEAGREAMIAGLCESPLTFQAIIIWRDELNDGKILLRDIIDLEATYAGPDGKNVPQAVIGEVAAEAEGEAAPALDDDALPPMDSEMDEDDMENNVSLSAMEAELKPKVLETFDLIADDYKKLRRLQDVNVESRLQNRSLSPSQDRKYKKL